MALSLGAVRMRGRRVRVARHEGWPVVLPQPKMLPRQIVVASCPMLPTAVIAAASDMAVSATFSLPWQAGSLPG